MGGGGINTWPPGGGGQEPPDVRPDEPGDDPCDIRFETTLNSIDRAILQKVNRGNALSVDFVDENNIPRLQVSLNGVLVGIISHPRTLDVIGCIKAGNRYTAIVVEKQGNLCRVRLERQLP